MKLIIGLGNPGKEYENTRHNIGFQVIDTCTSCEGWQSKFDGLFKKSMIGSESVIFLKPQTFMNRSGFSVVKFVNYFHIELEDILVIQDDLDLDMGKYRLKRNSSSGGHNGIQSIIDQLGTNTFLRLKIGVSHDRSINTADYVLGKFSQDETELLRQNVSLYQKIVESFIKYGFDKTMMEYSKK